VTAAVGVGMRRYLRMRYLVEVNVPGIRPDRRRFRLIHAWSRPTDKPVLTNDRSLGSVAAASGSRR